MNIPSPRSAKRARIEVVPLIDIIFFLLATFVLVSLSMIKNQGIPVRLPAAGSAAPQERDRSATVTITEAGQLFLNKEEIAMEPLLARLAVLREELGDDLRLFLNGDENARLGLAIDLLDATRKLGITKVAFETRPAEKVR